MRPRNLFYIHGHINEICGDVSHGGGGTSESEDGSITKVLTTLMAIDFQ